MERDSFVVYKSFLTAIKRLKRRDIQGELALAIIEYGITGTMTECGEIVELAMELIKPQIEANNQKYLNGKKGGAPKGNQNAKKQPKNNQYLTEKQPKNNLKQPNVNDNVDDIYFLNKKKQTHPNEGDFSQSQEPVANSQQPLNPEEKQTQTELTAWDEFGGDRLKLQEWIGERWNKSKEHYKTGTQGKVVLLGYSKFNLEQVAKNYTCKQINIAMMGVFIQKNLYPQFKLTPDKMLEPEHFARFYQAGLGNEQLFSEQK